ncbi:hypothetical protein [Myroides odoratus]|uniref:Uncharacterized protein n=1 Tax=Myroides odoratus TaxID=256 RepID=A0A9Q6Z3V7_MYROD|nr:hypothetical protein [Myroides odoratus]EHQ41489.1 hypothetical protein Myrod_0653 [Myroides odoratus DSM 2801]EKB02718.1 hypothetical protein HMPREF9716_03747 [Myroides odoratus CIP 103059]QQT98915.1 hypothetical protein I6I88_11890 [Myroides odoratus]WQD58900.1 hypothetical protein U0010_07085 [Myroides odoratus]STZ28752.1 Uncharacterised protein [Myroides odoratus]
MQLSLKIKKAIAREFLFLLLTVVLSIGGTYLFKKISTEKQKSISNIENIIIEFNNKHDLNNLKSFSGIECKRFKLYAVVVRNKQDENIAYEQTPDYNNELDLTYGELLDKVFDLNDSNIVFFYKWLKTKYRQTFRMKSLKRI